jgi:outer membrane protein assembly factor BamC
MVESMNPARQRRARRTTIGGLLVAGAALAAGCTGTLEDVMPDRQPSYKSSRSVPPLEVPPDLTSSTVRDTLPIPGVGATYSQYASEAGGAGTQVAAAVLPEVDDARIERRGDDRWLVVAMAPEEVWPRLRDFWNEQGFVLESAEPGIGLMETEWAARHTPLPGGLVRQALQRVTDAFYGVTFRDRYRTRIERGTEPDTTDIHISHRGAEQTVLGDERTRVQQDTVTEWVWQPLPSDPGLEAEMLSRLMLFLGVDEERADAMVAAGAPAAPLARLVREEGGAMALDLDGGFSPAWRRVGLALDRTGFIVEDRDRSRGLFFVRGNGAEDAAQDEDEGWFSWLKFWGNAEAEEDSGTYLVRVTGDTPDTTRVVVLNKDGARDVTPAASRILTVLHEQLR